jgi:hypothetical protein
MANPYHLFNGVLPGPDGSVAEQLQSVDIAVHRQRAIELYDFLTLDNKVLLELNVNPAPLTCIAGLPNSNKVRVLHSIGVGSSGIGAVSPIDGKLLFLHGDGNPDIGPPTPVTLPTDVLDIVDTLCMTAEQFDTNLTAGGAAYAWPLTPRIRAHEANNRVPIMRIAPIPAFLILDGFNGKDLDAAELIERIDSLDNNDGAMYIHLRNFLLACLTGHNQADACPRLLQDVIYAPPSNVARVWAQDKFKRSYPALQPAQVNQNPPQVAQPNIAALLAQIMALQQHQNNPNNDGGAAGEEKKEDEPADILNMSQQEIDSTIAMCGLPPGANVGLLPEWFRLCAAKGTSESYKKVIIRKHIMTHMRYDDAHVPLTNTILKMAAKRNWLGNEANVDCPSLVNASEGLSPFVVLDLNEDEVAALNAEDDAIASASSVTASELQATHSKRKATVPTDSETFLLMLMCFANLVFALFGADCPLFLCLVQVVTAIKAFSRGARDKMSQVTRASILWVILKQSRRFALGEMDIIQEYRGMHESLSYKMLGFTHAETPSSLLLDQTKPKSTSGKRSAKEDDKGKDAAPPAKKSKPNANSWHPTVKSALEPALRAGNNPGFLQVLTHCGVQATDLYSFFGRKCIPNCFFGRCYRGKECPRDHALPNEEQVKKILEVTKMFRDNPTAILQQG